jgi:hypothetical protein
MASTGKSEIMAPMFAIASNGFMQESLKETHQDPANQPVEEAPAEAPVEVPGEEDPKWHNRGNNWGRNKLFDLEQVVNEKEMQLAAVARSLGPNEYKKRCKWIDTCLKSKDENLYEKSGKAKSRS